MSMTRTTCPYCGVGCGVLAGADGTIKGDPDHPANFGRLCSKGAALGETIDLEGRLLHPKVNGADADWDTALDLVAQKFRAAIAEHGPESVAFYASGQLLIEDYYVANKLMKGFIGAANIDTNSRLCMASSVAGHKRAFGTDTVPGIYADLEQAELIVLVGSNLAWCHPVLYQRIAAAKAARPGMHVVNIDPRRTATTDLADMHLQIAPDGDIALFNGLLAHLADTGQLDAAFTKNHVNGAPVAIDAARASDPSQSGLTPQELANFFDLWAQTKRVVTVYSQGVNQASCGTDKVNAILNCHLATGRIGHPGAGPFSVTGQPNAMGGREVGGLANMLANHLELDNADHRQVVQEFWDSPTICTKPGLKAVDLFEACAKGKIKALWVMSTNPAASLPDSDGVSAAIAKVPFVVTSDIMEKTDTNDLAHVLLPATGWGEKDGTVTNSERRISRQRAFLPAPGSTRPDWKILSEVAARMGFGDAFDYQKPADIFAEYVALDKAASHIARDLDLSIFADADYARLIPTQWPRDDHRFFANGRFFHPDGKARMIAVTAPILAKPRFTLNTGRNRDQWHTMTRTGKSARLCAHLAEPYVEVNPIDAAELGVTPGALMTVESIYGRAILRALVTSRVAQGQLFAPMHWTRQCTTSGTVNSITTPRVDPFSGQPALKSNAVTVQVYEAKWYGFLACINEPDPQTPYAAIARTQTGWQVELASAKTPSDWETEARHLSGQAGGDASIQTDPATGNTRVAITQNGQITALLFAAPIPVVVSRTTIVDMIGTETPPLAALAGRSPSGRPDVGATICACFNVGRNTLLAAVENGAHSVAALGETTCAGTNCGACKPELTALLAQAHLPMAAE
ncbi:nitrate reductase [Roseobacter denitrificans]|uniref:Nitrate reductase n=1 Tax=Roseobacter denitrificans (strain ATCC 33942 / OCh 114) TaxID=375451 RepID=Q160I8_ROSDO|nr:nitrate reductase [Roseobacter denitrificans]ABG33605.1 nitrate reductase [Roseobacter denitrificans OCh 114]AVL52907.1 nitrate reductase [Roseobacter denitrificans]SFG03720.1 assimilatory nitrate reductase (NADH) alpha subunit apoprotein [Roseobacter denitrificans OCh 114]